MLCHIPVGAQYTPHFIRVHDNSDFMFSTYTWRLTPSLSWLDKVWP